MKLPAPPPDYDQLLAEIRESGRLNAVLAQVVHQRSPAQPYHSWDKLRYKTPPEGLTHEEWWVAVRLARHTAQRPIETLRDTAGRAFSYTVPDEILAALDQIARDASGNIGISEQVTNGATRDRYVVSSLIEEAITSSQLEGAATTRKVAKDMLHSGREPRDRSERMIVNNFAAMQRITELRNTAMTPELVKEIHGIVTEDTLEDPGQAGTLQSDEHTRIAVYDESDKLLHRPPPVHELPDRLHALCAFANGDQPEHYIPPVLRSITVHFMVGHDHYFADGNGRTARALFYWSMLRNGYWLTEFLSISRILKQAPAQYARSFLETEQDEGDLTYFFIHQLKVIQRAIRELHGYLDVKARELRELGSALSARPGDFNHRQIAALERAIRAPDSTFTARGHSRTHHVSGETARHDLMDLEQRGLLTRFKIGRQFAWSPVSDLPDRLLG